MKNIHVLPTENESRIRYNSFNKVYELCEFPKYHTDIKSTHNIYITSDEEIKEGDWCICLENIFKNEIFKVDSDTPNKSSNVTLEFAKKYLTKIILTTDQDLIEDGVQSIPDEFLEWFVKNPSCESVEIKWVKTPDGIFYHQDNVPYSCYKIIIPKEEQDYTALLKQVGTKQETLEEAAEKYSENWEETTGLDYENTVPSEVNKLDFINGAKWQAERMYSEEGIIDLIQFLSMNKEFNEYSSVSKKTARYFLEQFKKK